MVSGERWEGGVGARVQGEGVALWLVLARPSQEALFGFFLEPYCGASL